jgi:UDP-N-acetylglucosamine 3-dehydrogenase
MPCGGRSTRNRLFTWGIADVSQPGKLRCAVLSVLKHDYVARGLIAHPRFELAVVADDPHIPDWGHERNQQFADAHHIPYVRDVDRALREFDVQVAIVSPEAARHTELSIRAARAGKHVVQDKPLATRRSDCDAVVEAVERSGVKFLMWNRNFLQAVLHGQRQIAAGAIGKPYAIHIDFYFAKDAGPPRGTRQPGYPPRDWQAHQIAAHVDGSDGGLGPEPMGELAIEGIYPLGYVQMLTGARVRRVFARSAAWFHQLYVDNGVEDLASVTLEMEGGLVGSLALGRIGAASHPSGGEIKLHVLGSAGALVISEARPEVGIYYRNQPQAEARQRRVASDNDILLAENLCQAIDTGSETIMNVRASQAIFATIEAALESCRTGQPVDVR